MSFPFIPMMSFLSSLHSVSDWGLLVLRLAVGVIFLYHGPRKLNGAMGGFMLFIGICETCGALAVIAGFLTQLAALGLSIVMLGAIYKKINEWHVPFSALDKTGWELDLMILSGCIALILLGAGNMAVDPMVFGL